MELVGDHPGGVELVGVHSLRSGNGQETFPEVRNWLRDPFGGTELVGRPTGGPAVVGRPSWRSGSGRETLLEIRK